jgi:hypothetical protein
MDPTIGFSVLMFYPRSKKEHQIRYLMLFSGAGARSGMAFYCRL